MGDGFLMFCLQFNHCVLRLTIGINGFSNGFWKSEQRLEDKPVEYTLNRISLGPYTGKIHQTNVQWSNGGMETIHRYGFSASIKVLNSGLGPF